MLRLHHGKRVPDGLYWRHYDLRRRVLEHKRKSIKGFAGRYNITHLVYYEVTNGVNAASAREKHIKGWLRSPNLALVESPNPAWQDLSAEWFDDG
jgi:putative endonuclease